MKSPQFLLRQESFRPKKTLGQNFLIHVETAEKIVKWACVDSSNPVIEIGPGLGALTEALHERGLRVIAIERDPKLCQLIRERWPSENWLHLIHADALQVNFEEILSQEKSKFQVISNFPYSISTPLLEKLLERIDLFSQMVLLLQEEVVDRITAAVGTKDYGRLTIWIQILCKTERGPRISKGSFHPVPQVESRLLRLVPREKPLIPKPQIEPFLHFVRMIFQHRRKTVRNVLKSWESDHWDINSSLKKSKIDPQRRPETITIEELWLLFKTLESHSHP